MTRTVFACQEISTTMTTGEAVRAVRRQLRLTQREFAQKIRVTERAIQFYEAGARQPEPAALAALAQAACHAGDDALTAFFTDKLIRALGLAEREILLILVDVPQSPGDDPIQAYLRALEAGPDRATLLVTRHSPNEARYLPVIAALLGDLRSDDEQTRNRARGALDALLDTIKTHHNRV